MNEEVNTSLDENTENNYGEVKSEDLAIFADNLNISPTIRDIVDVFAKLQYSYNNKSKLEEGNNNIYTYEWLGEEELNGETVDKIYIHILVDSEFVG